MTPAMGYTQMKDSGIPWLGEYPAHWNCGKVKNAFFATKTIVGNEVDDYERLALTMNGVIKRSKTDAGGLQPERFETYQILHENELVFKLIDLQNVATSRVGRSPYTGIVSPAYIILHERNEKSTKYAEYYFLSMWMHQVFNQLGADGVRSNIGASGLLNIPFLMPPEEEQESIADYLDTQCTKIDEIIAEAKASIEDYKQWKASVIHEAVTKGLNPDVEMQEIGIEWIGRMPSHWKKKKMFHCFEVIGSGTTPKSIDDDYYSGEIPWLQSGDINGGVVTTTSKCVTNSALADIAALKVYKAPFIAIAMYGASIANTSMVHIDACTNQACCVLSIPTSEICFEYIFYAILASKEELLLSARGGTQPNISQEIIKQMRVPIPPIEEQIAIAAHLKKMVEEIALLINEKQALISDLESYKKSLVYEVVTGKKKVV